MVDIRLPPPVRNLNPQWVDLKPGTNILRIFDPTRYQATPTGFRYYGPLSRFDHQRRKEGNPQINSDRGVFYAGFTVACCLIEVFGDAGIVEIKKQQIAKITLTENLKLLDLRGQGAWDAGSVTAMTFGKRVVTQAWSRYFYENSDLYGDITGLIYNNAHNGQEAIALYERAIAHLETAEVFTLNLSNPLLRESLLFAAHRLGLIINKNSSSSCLE